MQSYNFFFIFQNFFVLLHANMRKIVLFMALWLFIGANAQSLNEAYTAYIKKYAKTAQAQQKKYGIPASITLAQGLLESSAGRSELTLKSNNHFGIKCGSDWKGESVTYDDDARNECFRKYSKAEDSFEDHSLFLKKARYASLFALQSTDYQGWAHGLKSCGYATDPGYAGKLIKIIEDYGLSQYDGGKSTASQDIYEEENIDNVVAESTPMVSASKKKTKKSVMAMPTLDLYQEHTVYKHSGRKYIVARAGETYAGIAYLYNMYEQTLRKYNDANDGRELKAGDKVYFYKKRARAAHTEAYYRVREGETAWKIAQDKAIQLKTIYELNGIESGQEVHINQQLKLR